MATAFPQVLRGHCLLWLVVLEAQLPIAPGLYSSPRNPLHRHQEEAHLDEPEKLLKSLACGLPLLELLLCRVPAKGPDN